MVSFRNIATSRHLPRCGGQNFGTVGGERAVNVSRFLLTWRIARTCKNKASGSCLSSPESFKRYAHIYYIIKMILFDGDSINNRLFFKLIVSFSAF